MGYFLWLYGRSYPTDRPKGRQRNYLTENTTEKMRYVFSDIVTSSFLWRKERMNENGEWQTVAKVTAERK